MNIALVWLCPVIGSQNNILKQLSLAKTVKGAEVSLWMVSPSKIQRDLSLCFPEISKIFEIDCKKNPSQEEYLDMLTQLFKAKKVDLIMLGSSLMSGAIAPRLGYRLGGGCVTSVLKITEENKKITVDKACYGHNMLSSLVLNSPVNTITIAKEYSNKLELTSEYNNLTIKKVPYISFNISDWATKRVKEIIPVEKGLETSKKVLIGGRGIASKETFAKLEEISKALEASLGATRPAVLNGWAKFEQMIGQSGSILGAKKVVVLGVSGSAAFAVGITGCKKNLAINSDPNANIFKYVDIGIIADAEEIIFEMEKILEIPDTLFN